MKPTQISQLQEIVRSNERLAVKGAGSKPALSAPEEALESVELTGLAGMMEYQPDEFTFTALAGTRLADVQAALNEHGQYLPFDPPLVERGATLGGTVAAGLSGPGRYRYGGLRDFLLGVAYINGKGDLLRAGGKVVKNAAGFDIPKLMIGSLGCYGALVELTFKVFPRPPAYATLRASYPSIEAAMAGLVHLATSPLEVFALDISPDADFTRLLVRLGGLPESFAERAERIQAILQSEQVEILHGGIEEGIWRSRREFSWVPEGAALVKVPLTPKRALGLHEEISADGAKVNYSVGANLAWIAWQEPLDELDALLVQRELSGLLIFGANGSPRLGVRVGDTFARRVKAAFDPTNRWVEV
jgi:glycolate oxidase FAD binding subunit